MQSGKRHSCQSLGSEVNNTLIKTQIPTGKFIQMSVRWWGDGCLSLMTSTWGHFSFNIHLKGKIITSVGIFNFIFYFKFFKILINIFPERLQSKFFQPNHCSLLTPVPMPLTPPLSNHCRWICYTLWKSKARLRHWHLHRLTCWWVMMLLLELSAFAFVLRKGLHIVIFSICFFFP